MASTPYDKIREALEELRATAPRTHEERTQSRLPARSTTHRQEDQNQRKSTLERLGPSGSHNRESRRDHSQNYRVEQPRKTRSRAPAQTTSQDYSHQNNSWPEGGAESEFKEAGTHDRFPYFANRLASIRLPHKFKPSNHSKYDGKTEPR